MIIIREPCGLSSFDYLRQLPVEHVKIDGNFIQSMLGDATNHAIVKAVADISRLMGKTIIAESVETQDTEDAVRALGIEFAQGYHYADPAPIDLVLGSRS